MSHYYGYSNAPNPTKFCGFNLINLAACRDLIELFIYCPDHDCLGMVVQIVATAPEPNARRYTFELVSEANGKVVINAADPNIPIGLFNVYNNPYKFEAFITAGTVNAKLKGIDKNGLEAFYDALMVTFISEKYITTATPQISELVGEYAKAQPCEDEPQTDDDLSPCAPPTPLATPPCAPAASIAPRGGAVFDTSSPNSFLNFTPTTISEDSLNGLVGYSNTVCQTFDITKSQCCDDDDINITVMASGGFQWATMILPSPASVPLSSQSFVCCFELNIPYFIAYMNTNPVPSGQTAYLDYTIEYTTRTCGSGSFSGQIGIIRV